ncbi:MAG: type IV secretion system protein [Treponema sp.]|jgi:type IV secretion system protein VirB5|nr:type IV secretion system protein [Treponema sp.]
MPAQHKKTSYKPVPIPNPFRDDGDKAFADLLADKIKESNWWRRSALANLFFFAVSLLLFYCSVNQQKTVPILVNVMPSGEAEYLGEVRQNGDFQVPDAAIHFQVRAFVSNLRSVSTDYQVLYNNIDDCFNMVTSNYSPIMRDMLIKNSPFDLVGKIRRTVSIESVLNITGRSYQINWAESVIETSSSGPKNAKMRAVVTVRLITPTDATIKRNPLGIYIENFEMTEL